MLRTWIVPVTPRKREPPSSEMESMPNLSMAALKVSCVGRSTAVGAYVASSSASSNVGFSSNSGWTSVDMHE
jgi:hypothetical protein